MYEVLDWGKHGLVFRLLLKGQMYIIMDTIEQRNYKKYCKNVYNDEKWGTFVSNISGSYTQATQIEFDVFCYENPLFTNDYCNMNVAALANMDARFFPKHIFVWKEELDPLKLLMDEKFLQELEDNFATPDKSGCHEVHTTICRKRIEYF